MTDKQEFESLDNLFRKTFEELPAAPSSSGWDAPSPRVWEQVQTQIQPRPGAWTKTHSLLTATAIVLVLAAGLYWWRSAAAEKTPAPPSVAPPVEQPAITPGVPSATAPTDAAPASPLPTNQPATRTDHKRPVASPSTAVPNDPPADPQPTVAQPDPGKARPLPGSKSVSKNNTEERNQQEDKTPRHQPADVKEH